MRQKLDSPSSESVNFESDMKFVEDLIQKNEKWEMVWYSIYDFKSEKAKKIVDSFLNTKNKPTTNNIWLELKSLLKKLKSGKSNQEETNEWGFFNKIKQVILKLVGKTNIKLTKTLNDDIDINEIDLDKAIKECDRHIVSHKHKNAKNFLELIVKKQNKMI